MISALEAFLVERTHSARAIKQRHLRFAIAAPVRLAYAYYEHLIDTGALRGPECKSA